MIRPQPATWFEVVAARDDVLLALEALARTGAVELESQLRDAARGDPTVTTRHLREYGELAARYRSYWPNVDLASVECHQAPEAALAAALDAIRSWAQDVDPLVVELQRLESVRSTLAQWQKVIRHLTADVLDLGALANAGPNMEAALFVFNRGATVSLTPSLLAKEIETDGDRSIIVVGTRDAVAALAEQAAALQGRKFGIPQWLAANRDANVALIAEREAACEREIEALRAKLIECDRQHQLQGALADVARAAWCFQRVGPIDAGTILSRMTGWTSDPARVIAALDASGARALAHFPPPPANAQPPLLLRNPRWIRPFEIFSRLLGMPGRFGADPSALLAIVAPLMFGYMFGDVGQGLVLLIAGLVLSRRMPALRLLVAGGISSMIFGVMFGSVFSVEGVVPALWVHPIAAPLPVLVVPLIGGAILLGIGLALGGLEAWWGRDFRRWLLAECGLLAVYAGLMLAFAQTEALYLAAAGVAWHLLGNAYLERRMKALWLAAAQLAERTIQILINTLSFVRVGAFALAHAGLSAAVVALANGTGGGVVGYALVLVAGNAVILLLEVLVVSIQTTRLVLFEFFTRFFVAKGREFRPLAPPSVSAEENLHEATR